MQVRDPLSPRVSVAAPTRTASVAIVAALVIVLDQITKVWAVAALDDRTIHVAWKLQLRLVRNPGTAFSLGEGKGPLLGVVACIVAIVLVRLALQPRSFVSAIGLALILGGAIGNVIDRLRLGYVVDFVDAGIGSLRWYTFNVADASITVGVVILLVVIERGDRAARRG
jgi:signal peptidase II